MHGNLRFGDQVVMAGDAAPDRYEEPKGFSLSIHIKSTADAETGGAGGALENLSAAARPEALTA